MNLNKGLEVGGGEIRSAADSGASARRAEALLAGDDHSALLSRLPGAPAAARRSVRSPCASLSSIAHRFFPSAAAACVHSARALERPGPIARDGSLCLSDGRWRSGFVRAHHSAGVAPIAQPPDRHASAARRSSASALRGAFAALSHAHVHKRRRDRERSNERRGRCPAAALCALAATASRLRLPALAHHRTYHEGAHRSARTRVRICVNNQCCPYIANFSSN